MIPQVGAAAQPARSGEPGVRWNLNGEQRWIGSSVSGEVFTPRHRAASHGATG
jgi:hypothetical protein